MPCCPAELGTIAAGACCERDGQLSSCTSSQKWVCMKLKDGKSSPWFV
jgi:hypothetical protein